MAIARFHNENDLPEEPPPPPPVTVDSSYRAPGGVMRGAFDHLPAHAVRAHTEALNNLGAAIRQLAEAITAAFRPPTPETPQADPGSPGPAKGLTMQVRPTPDHRNPNARSSFGFAPVKAETGDTEL